MKIVENEVVDFQSNMRDFTTRESVNKVCI